MGTHGGLGDIRVDIIVNCRTTVVVVHLSIRGLQSTIVVY